MNNGKSWRSNARIRFQGMFILATYLIVVGISALPALAQAEAITHSMLPILLTSTLETGPKLRSYSVTLGARKAKVRINKLTLNFDSLHFSSRSDYSRSGIILDSYISQYDSRNVYKKNHKIDSLYKDGIALIGSLEVSYHESDISLINRNTFESFSCFTSYIVDTFFERSYNPRIDVMRATVAVNSDRSEHGDEKYIKYTTDIEETKLFGVKSSHMSVHRAAFPTKTDKYRYGTRVLDYYIMPKCYWNNGHIKERRHSALLINVLEGTAFNIRTRRIGLFEWSIYRIALKCPYQSCSFTEYDASLPRSWIKSRRLMPMIHVGHESKNRYKGTILFKSMDTFPVLDFIKW